MTVRNLPARQLADETTPTGSAFETGASQNVHSPTRSTAGAWISVGLSVIFYLTMLAIDAKYDGRHPLRSKSTASTILARSGSVAKANVPASGSKTLTSRSSIR